MNELTPSPNRQAWTDFMGLECAHCHGKKPSAMSFCKKCYFTLPVDMRQGLYRRFGSGYEEAYFDALEWLRREA